MNTMNKIGDHKERLVGRTIRFEAAPVGDPPPDMEVLDYVTDSEEYTVPVIRVRYPNGFEIEIPAVDEYSFEFVDDVEPRAQS